MSKTLKRLVWLVVLLYCLSLAPSLYAEEYNALRKLRRGAVNIILGWLEVPGQMIITSEEKGPLKGIFLGGIKGFCFFLGRACLGAYETVTFLVPPYTPLVEPEFVLPEEWEPQEDKIEKESEDAQD